MESLQAVLRKKDGLHFQHTLRLSQSRNQEMGFATVHSHNEELVTEGGYRSLQTFTPYRSDASRKAEGPHLSSVF